MRHTLECTRYSREIGMCQQCNPDLNTPLSDQGFFFV